jgi:hypothetical protein
MHSHRRTQSCIVINVNAEAAADRILRENGTTNASPEEKIRVLRSAIAAPQAHNLSNHGVAQITSTIIALQSLVRTDTF